ncbi:reverse transcriptase [Teladorsagia circumcincta]|uniref:RNA-directed DNA polymerase n=1 Tax=Teladorsagia circumcincta TaxID=45464 RepID=A0A2G9UUD9_TELCI|nr:reverse transcriptase [Teladorsagia circumcincta]
MDADTLRAILSAQAASQAAAQEKMLQAVMKEMRGLFSTMASSPTTAHATSAEFVTNSLSARLPEFTHDPENGCTFDVWYSRYEDIITQDGATLDDAARAHLIVSKLDTAAYARFTNHILPRRAAEIPLADTVKTLQELFGHNTSVFARRYAYLKTQCNGESLRDYTGLVNRRHEMAEFNAITAEQMKCLVWICGLVAPEYADIRTHALRKLESNPQTTLRELSTEIQQLLDIRQDAKLLGSPPSPAAPLSEVNAVDVKKGHSKEPPSPCFRCGGPHWAKECDFMEKRTSNLKKKRKRANQVVIAASTTNDIALIKRIYRTVEINGASTRMRLDTGADVTLLNDIFAKLNGGKYFSQLDLAEAYLQMEVDEESRPLLTINTHRGLYRLNRLPFGVKAAPAIFQQQMETLTAGLDGTAAYLDDIIVTGKTIDEHNARLEAVFKKIQDFGFRLRLEKCSLLRTEIRYFGFIIDADGRRPDPAKVDAIQRMPVPKDVSQLRAFLGLVNFYGTFVRELHNLRAPLDALAKKDAAYMWSSECQSCFDRIKKTLKSDLLLAHYDPTLPLIARRG